MTLVTLTDTECCAGGVGKKTPPRGSETARGSKNVRPSPHTGGLTVPAVAFVIVVVIVIVTVTIIV